jgi:aryl-alcohol dehydrogenase-like predicted oxidoreductase
MEAAPRKGRLMEYRLLGLSGCAVSALTLGTLTFGHETTEADSFSRSTGSSRRAGR